MIKGYLNILYLFGSENWIRSCLIIKVGFFLSRDIAPPIFLRLVSSLSEQKIIDILEAKVSSNMQRGPAIVVTAVD